MSSTSLTRRQSEILDLLDPEDWRTSRDLADALGMRSKASLTGLLRTLAAKGLVDVERVGSEHDHYAERRYRKRPGPADSQLPDAGSAAVPAGPPARAS